MKLSIKGIFVGGITDIFLSNLLSIPFIIFVMVYAGISSKVEGAAAGVTAAIHSSPVLYATHLIIGIICSVIGGYVAARLARHNELLNGALASWLCVGIGVYSLISGKGSTSLPVHLLLITLTPIFYLVGAYLRLSGANDVAEKA